MARGRVSFLEEDCKGCELCIHFCPRHILGLDRGRINASGYHPVTNLEPDNCNGCGICALMCPDIVIRVERE